MRRAGKSRWEAETESTNAQKLESLRALLREFMPGWEVLELRHDRDVVRELEAFAVRMRINVESSVIREHGLDAALRGAALKGPEDARPFIEDDEADLPSAKEGTEAE